VKVLSAQCGLNERSGGVESLSVLFTNKKGRIRKKKEEEEEWHTLMLCWKGPTPSWLSPLKSSLYLKPIWTPAAMRALVIGLGVLISETASGPLVLWNGDPSKDFRKFPSDLRKNGSTSFEFPKDFERTSKGKKKKTKKNEERNLVAPAIATLSSPVVVVALITSKVDHPVQATRTTQTAAKQTQKKTK
jgi:hypothetical protein